jgi:hypothetical protein
VIKKSTLIVSVCLSLFQLCVGAKTDLLTAEAQSRCNPEILSNPSSPSRDSREIRSERNRFKFQVPVNYRAVASRDHIFVFSPQAYEYYQCQPAGSIWYSSTEIWVADSELHPSVSLRQAFNEQRMNQQPIQGSIQQVTVGGQSALRYHVESGGDGLTRNYFLFSPQQTKFITISSWVDSVNSPEPEVLDRTIKNFELLFSVTEQSPRIGIVPTLDVCGLAVWQNSNDNLTHLLTAMGGESLANVRIDNQRLRLSSNSERITPEQTRRPGNFIFQNPNRSMTVTLQGNWRNEYPGAEVGWITNSATLKVTKGGQTTELPVVASLGCNFLFY